MILKLTDKQAELLKFIVEFKEKNDYFPSIREMVRAFGLKSPAPIQHRLDKLIKAGAIKRPTERTARALVLQPYSRIEIIKPANKKPA
jgi:repressor LexA